jgi:hypothetical protein
MPTYSQNGIVARFPNQLAGMSVSGLLSNKATLHVKVSPGAAGELFALLSPDYTIQMTVGSGVVTLRRNHYEARKEIGAVQRHFQILASWKPDCFQLALMIDDNVGGPDACVTIHTDPIYVPVGLLQWARRLNLLARTTYSSAAEFLGIFLESLRQANRTIRDTNSFKLFWDRQRTRNASRRIVPKNEPEAMAGIAGYLQDQSLLAGYQLLQETQAGTGSLDLRALAALEGGGFVNICVEGKNAHSTDLEHGVTNQLPAYMRSAQANYGVYLVLWYKCEAFPEPAQDNIDVTWGLTKLRPWENIVVESFDLAIPTPPSARTFEYS